MKIIYFVGAGGIGMSALVRYALKNGYRVAGYDKTRTPLTEQLISEGADIVYDDSVTLIPSYCSDPSQTLVVCTPAVPNTHRGLTHFRENGYQILKRAELLGELTKDCRTVCFAGTHGKTTTSTLCAHILKSSSVDCNAFLGGIMKDYDSNLMLSPKTDLTVIEADEYDRSFHQLRPYIAVITSTDPDHLDIYKTPEAYWESFAHFTSLIKENGFLVTKKGIHLTIQADSTVKRYTYSAEEVADFYATNIRIGGGEVFFDFVTPTGKITDIQLGVPVKINIENSIASMAAAWLCGASEEELKRGTASYHGAKRRFDFHIKTPNLVFLDDYGHHPEEVKASIESIKMLYPDKKLSVIFQPHLYSRTKDFYCEFAQSLSLADEVILLDIYPARELPIPNVTSQLIFDRLTCVEKTKTTLNDLPALINQKSFSVLMTLGAGDIDLSLPELTQILSQRL